MNRIAESGSSALPFVLETTKEEDEVVVKEIVNVSPSEDQHETKRTVLRMGSEGDDVRARQEALQKLGFYSGEEDMEFSSFSSGTESAVKTWQATLGAPENGIMTPELVERLYMEQQLGDSVSQKSANKAAIAEDGVSEVEVYHHRVYLLGENRWEEPSRLNGRSGTVAKCVSCRGEGRLICIECDGTGEPNIEPQFIEWVKEAAKCPHCNGVGFVTCDTCEGRKVAQVLYTRVRICVLYMARLYCKSFSLNCILMSTN